MNLGTAAAGSLFALLNSIETDEEAGENLAVTRLEVRKGLPDGVFSLLVLIFGKPKALSRAHFIVDK